MTGKALARHQPTNGVATLGTAVDKLDPFAVGRVLAASGFFPDARQEAQAVAKVIAGMELGFGPMAAMTGVHIIDGKPSLAANLLATCVKRHPNYDYRVREHTDATCSIEFFQDRQSIGTSEFSIADATRAGISAKTNFKRYPKAMLFARALSQGVRWYCPDVTAGAPAYVPEELGAEVNEDGEPATPAPELAASAEPISEFLDAARVELIVSGFRVLALKYREIDLLLGSSGVDALRANSAKAVQERIESLTDAQATALIAELDRRSDG